MTVTQVQVNGLKEDIRAISDVVSEVLVRVANHDARFDQIDLRLDKHDARLDGIDGRLDGIDGRLDGMQGALNEILVLVRKG